jgi:hypothetical protein
MSGRGKGGKAKAKAKSRSSRAGLQFPVGRIHGFLCLFWQENGLDVWQNTTLGNGDTRQEFVQFLVVSDGQL